MTFYFFLWTNVNERKIAINDVTKEEAEYVVSHPEIVEISRSSGRLAAYGYTETGRRLFVPYEKLDDATIFIVTAYEPEYY